MIIRKFEQSWKDWIFTNISNGQNLDGIFTILLNHGFEYDLIKNELKYESDNELIKKCVKAIVIEKHRYDLSSYENEDLQKIINEILFR